MSPQRIRRVRLTALAVAAGAVTELVAWATRTWVYDPGWLPVVNVAIMFGGVMAWVAFRWYAAHPAVPFAAGAAIGVAYELLNAYALRLWSFPDDRFLVFEGYALISLVIGLMWGLVPLGCVLVERALERA